MCKRDGLACMRGLLAIFLTHDLSHNITNMFVDTLDSLRWAVQASRRLVQRAADAWGSISRVDARTRPLGTWQQKPCRPLLSEQQVIL